MKEVQLSECKRLIDAIKEREGSRAVHRRLSEFQKSIDAFQSVDQQIEQFIKNTFDQ